MSELVESSENYEVVAEQEDPTDSAIRALIERYPETISREDRPGYSGVVVHTDGLVEVATAIRDDFGFNYLSSVTGVDLIEENQMEVVYHSDNIDAGGSLVFRVRADRDYAVVPSLVSVWPGADFQEREAWDLLGIKFDGHPNLQRILTWEGFAGHPLRKDWKEPFFEDDHKPFGSRWPGGDVIRAEEDNLYGMNVQYPKGWKPSDQEFNVDSEIYSGLSYSHEPDRSGLKTDQITVNMGPQHPSTHGVFRMVVNLDGETIKGLAPVMGYLHRNHEKIGERNTFGMNMPYTDRLDYISSMSNNHGYALAIEELLGVEVAERAEWIRILMVELTRVANHMWALGFLLNDLGALQTPMIYFYLEREMILDFFEAASGARLLCNYMRFGGVAYDLPDMVRAQPTMEFLHDLIYENIPRVLEQGDELMTGNEIVKGRSIGVGYLSAEDAIAYSTAGPVLRASGVPFDIRRAEPYSYYEHLDFDVAVRYNGDIYDRYLIRLDEIQQSLRILEQVLPYLQQTTGAPVVTGKPAYAVRAPAEGEVYGRVENPKGELGYYVTAKRRGSNPERYHIRAPSFINLTALSHMSEGHKVADLVAILGSIDIVLGEVDR